MQFTGTNYRVSWPAGRSAKWLWASAMLLLTLVGGPGMAWGQFELSQAPINYFKTAPNDAVARLQKRITAGEAKLAFAGEAGYLKSLLEHLRVPVSSQSLVFSKTSLQVKYISPRSPRAIYFNDDVYVGFVQGGVLEISAVDPLLGANFYVLDQHETDSPRIARQTFDCLQCHSSALTRDVPGHMIRSVPTGPDGHLATGGESYLTDHNSPLKERWGGWYVTGEHGAQRHLGNLFVRQADQPASLNLEPGANVTDLRAWVETSAYLSPHSDLVALMVLEHQANMHNRLARASFLARVELLDPDSGEGTPARKRRLREMAEPVVRHLLFADEIKLVDRIAGTSGFAKEFAARGPCDSQGRSLREFDLGSRMFKYPCSYLIYSEAFEQLPSPLKQEVIRQLGNVLTGKDQGDAFKHLSTADRTAILEILRDTKPEFRDFGRTIEPKPAALEK